MKYTRTNKKITKLSMRIMLMLCFLLLPYTILFSVLRSTIKDQLNDNESSELDFAHLFPYYWFMQIHLLTVFCF